MALNNKPLAGSSAGGTSAGVVGQASTRVLTQTVIIAFAVTAIAVYGASAISPVLPDIASEFGVDPAQASLLVSLFILPMAVLTPLIGFVADRLTLRPVLIVCLLLYGAAGVVCAVAPSFQVLLGLRILQGCGGAALELFGLVILIEAVEPANLHSAIGRNASVIGISTAAAPLLSGLLSLISWRATFLSALVAFPLALAVRLYLPDLPHVEKRTRPSLLEFLRKRVVIGALVSTLMVFLFLFGVLLSFVPEHARRIGIHSDFIIALVPASTAIAITVTAPFMASLLQRLGTRNVIALAHLLYALSMASFWLSSSFAMLEAGAILLGAAHGLLFPLIQSLLAKEAPSEGSVVFMSFNIAAIGIGQTVTPLITSAIYETVGLAAVFGFATALALAMIPLSWAFFAIGPNR
jgi:MFS transporter, ACDE family, multidrug resistance protein